MRIPIVIRKIESSLFLFSGKNAQVIVDPKWPFFIKNNPFVPIFTYDKWGLRADIYRLSYSERSGKTFSELLEIAKDGRNRACFFRDGMRGSLAFSADEIRRQLFIPTR